MQHSVHFTSADYNEEMKTVEKLTLTLHKTKDTKNYVGEFEGRHNDRPLNTIDQMSEIARGSVGLWRFHC